jgi:hypothetical protein
MRIQNFLKNLSNEELVEVRDMADKLIVKQQLRECWETAHQAGRFEGKGVAEEGWQSFDDYYNEITSGD